MVGKALRIGGVILGGLVALVLLAFVGLWGWTRYQVTKTWDVPTPAIIAASDAGAVARGERMGRIAGCLGCHGPDLTGAFEMGDAMTGRLVASNLTHSVPRYTDAQLARAIRGGVNERGRGFWGMPSEGFIDMSDADVADLIAYLRAQPKRGAVKPQPSFGPLGMVGVLKGDFQTQPNWIAEARAKPAPAYGPAFARGRYLVQVACTECHRSDLKGDGEPGGAPDMMIAASYDLDGFRTLMRTGKAADGKERRLMSGVARDRFVHFTDEEIAQIHAYLTARAERAP